MKISFKKKQDICSIIYFLAFLALIGANCDNDLTLFVIKNLICIAIMIVSAVIGDLTDMEE